MEYIIYSLTCKDKDVAGIYVGSTSDFVSRQSKHKCDSKDKNKNHIKLYKCMNETKGWLNWEFTFLQVLTCTESDARILERLWYDKLDADLNMRKPHLTKEEKKIYDAERHKLYYSDNRDALLEYSKNYYSYNKEELLENNNVYRSNNKEAILEQKKHYYIDNKDKLLEYQKQFRLDNREKIAEQEKKHYVKNKQKISERQRLYNLSNKEKNASRKSEKIFCESCELYCCRGDKARHYKTQNHIANLANFTDK